MKSFTPMLLVVLFLSCSSVFGGTHLTWIPINPLGRVSLSDQIKEISNYLKQNSVAEIRVGETNRATQVDRDRFFTALADLVNQTNPSGRIVFMNSQDAMIEPFRKLLNVSNLTVIATEDDGHGTFTRTLVAEMKSSPNSPMVLDFIKFWVAEQKRLLPQSSYVAKPDLVPLILIDPEFQQLVLKKFWSTPPLREKMFRVMCDTALKP